MKKLLIILTALLILAACKNEPKIKDYVTISGKVNNAKGTILSIANQNYEKEIEINEDGSFSDTLKVEDGIYVIQNGSGQAVVQLKNGYNLSVNFDAEDINNSISFTGLGAGTNNYMATKIRFQDSENFSDFNSIFKLEKPDFNAKVESLKSSLDDLISNALDLDSTMMVNEVKSNKELITFLTANYEKKHRDIIAFAKGKPSPKFVNYENHKGGTTSLDDLKGKYVYVDVWATWCGPCKREIPFLKEVEKEFHGKNIEFVSISIDKKEAHQKWKDMVTEKELGGIQLYADNGWNSQFVRDYGIEGIPRFLLIDDKGNIVNADAPRPSNPKLKELLNGLLN